LPEPQLITDGNDQQNLANFLQQSIAKTTQQTSRKQLKKFTRRIDQTDRKIADVTAVVHRQGEAITSMEERLRNEFSEEIKSIRAEAASAKETASSESTRASNNGNGAASVF